MYNLVNEPWLKYSMAGIADQGLRSSQWTSARLRSQTLYLETATERYELSYLPPANDEARGQDLYQLARCKAALPLGAMRRAGVPAPASDVEVIVAGAAWDEFKWSNLSVAVRGTTLALLRMHFHGNAPPGGGRATPSAA
jgi:hypothetical protein